MKKILIPLLAILLMASCHKANRIEPINTNVIQTGDLVFVALPTDYDAAPGAEVRHINSDTDEVIYAHVAIAEVANDSLFIIDATFAHGVDRHPFDTLMATYTLPDGSQPRYDVYRLRNNRQARQFIKLAKRYCGRDYDIHFDLNNEEQYCSELVRNSYVLTTSHDLTDTLFPIKPMDFNLTDGTLPPYWSFLFGLIQSPVPQGEPGILPVDIANSPNVRLVTRNYQYPARR